MLTSVFGDVSARCHGEKERVCFAAARDRRKEHRELVRMRRDDKGPLDREGLGTNRQRGCYFFREESIASNSPSAEATVAAGPVSLKNTMPSGASTIAPTIL